MFKPILMAVCAGVFIASYTVVDAKGVRASETVLQYIIYLTLFQSIPIPMLAFFKTRSALTQAVRDHWRVGAMGGVYLASYGLVLFALSLDAVAKVSPCGKPVLLSAPSLLRCSSGSSSAGDGCFRHSSLSVGSS